MQMRSTLTTPQAHGVDWMPTELDGVGQWVSGRSFLVSVSWHEQRTTEFIQVSAIAFTVVRTLGGGVLPLPDGWA